MEQYLWKGVRLRREAAKIFCLRCAYVEFFKGVKYFLKSLEAQKRIETTQEMSHIVIAHSLQSFIASTGTLYSIYTPYYTARRRRRFFGV